MCLNRGGEINYLDGCIREFTMLSYQLLLLLTISSFTYGFLGRKKNITVTGELNCGRNYYSNVKVELWEADT
ncbi:unnamed protein product, partial [Onchocerca ochengi]|uniref:Transthyretin-like family protein n=1 Tax=Onchocerca ochengi TaxID=42157 RepID=A0A182EYV2_ONCOC